MSCNSMVVVITWPPLTLHNQGLSISVVAVASPTFRCTTTSGTRSQLPVSEAREWLVQRLPADCGAKTSGPPADDEPLLGCPAKGSESMTKRESVVEMFNLCSDDDADDESNCCDGASDDLDAMFNFLPSTTEQTTKPMGTWQDIFDIDSRSDASPKDGADEAYGAHGLNLNVVDEISSDPLTPRIQIPEIAKPQATDVIAADELIGSLGAVAVFVMNWNLFLSRS